MSVLNSRLEIAKSTVLRIEDLDFGGHDLIVRFSAK